MATSSQKFIARNRAPRVQIEYDVELYGAEKKIQLPFVMGVLSDLSGKPVDPLAPVADRKFLEIDVDNFDARMKAMKPRVAFAVPNTLTGDGNMSVDITFESMDDFSPAAIARKVDSLSKLLDARNQLQNLVTYMDGKTGAEELVSKVLARSGAAGLAGRSGQAQGIAQQTQPDPDPRRTRMAEAQKESALAAVEFEGSDLASLLKKEFKPKTDEAKSAVEQAVQTLAQQALAQTQLIGKDTVKSIEAMIAAIDKKLIGSDQSDPAPRGLPEARGRVARSALPGEQHRDRRAAEDPRDEHLQGGSRQDAQALQGHRLGPEPDLQEDLRRRVRPVRRRALRLPGGRLPLRPERRPTSNCWARWPRWRRRAHAPFITGAAPTVMQMDSWQELANPRDLTKIFTTPEYAAWRSLRESEDAKYLGLAMPRFLSRMPYGARTESGRGVQLRGRHRRGRPHQVHLGQRRLRDGDQHQPLVQAVRLVLAHPRHRVRRCGRGAADAHASRRTTGAWT